MSSRKNTLKKFQSLTNGSMAGSLTSAVTSIQYLDNIGIQFNFTGSPVGNLQVQISADYAQDASGNVTNAGNWVPLSLAGSPNIDVASGSPIYVDIPEISAPWIRAAYIRTSGSGTLNIFVTAKEI